MKQQVVAVMATVTMSGMQRITITRLMMKVESVGRALMTMMMMIMITKTLVMNAAGGVRQGVGHGRVQVVKYTSDPALWGKKGSPTSQLYDVREEQANT